MKSLKNLGKILNKEAQRVINGSGNRAACISYNSCQTSSDCYFFSSSTSGGCVAVCNNGECIGIPL
ncbi:MAG: hypothetical protein ACI8RP_000317 [Urechidicola sp.]|jgi:hypothetical protein